MADDGDVADPAGLCCSHRCAFLLEKSRGAEMLLGGRRAPALDVATPRRAV